MSSHYSVHVHQGSSGPSSASSSSRSPSSSAHSGSSDSRSVSIRREYESAGRTAEVVRSGGGILIINHGRRDYEHNSPSPRYGGTYQ
ncbi:hypothetical protein Trco_002344 [Trichoderma cornu-damae]|uniref:Uncharacterized protein n=1 Tax=Trichoderma cornu-damae TaxID=654480 RepID=A0A9P8QUH5_9HYPO|nr:hypothetical protein Trco_002344 [Trichoderma cornu-damae]